MSSTINDQLQTISNNQLIIINKLEQQDARIGRLEDYSVQHNGQTNTIALRQDAFEVESKAREAEARKRDEASIIRDLKFDAGVTSFKWAAGGAGALTVAVTVAIIGLVGTLLSTQNATISQTLNTQTSLIASSVATQAATNETVE